MKHHRLPALELCPTSRVSSSWMVGSRFWVFADWPSGLDCFQGVIGFRQVVSSHSPWCWFFPGFFTHLRGSWAICSLRIETVARVPVFLLQNKARLRDRHYSAV